MFGANNTSFGSAPAFGSSFTGFGNTSFSTPQQGASLFGASNPASSGGLFSNNTSSMFAAPVTTAAFGGFGAQQPAAGSLFGSSTLPTFNSTTGQFFGQQPQASNSFMSTTSAASNSLFGGGISSFATQSVVGTTVKLTPVDGTDTVLKNGTNQTIKTKLQCITGMKEYESKSLEELRCEDYAANRKTAGTGTLQTSFLGAIPTTTSAGTFGAGLFNTTKPAFSSGFGALGTTATTNSLFGNTARPNLFSSPATTTSLFGSTQTGGLFGNTARPAFGAPTFGAPASSGTATGLFGSSVSTTPAFGAPNFGATNLTNNAFPNFGQSQTSTSFATQSTQPSLFGASTQAGGLFGAKPLGTAFPTPNSGSLFQTAAPASSFGNFFNSAPSMFGSQAARPSGTGLFNTSTTFGQPQQQPSLFGGSNMGSVLGNNNPSLLGNTGNTSLVQNDLANQQLLIQQGLLLMSKYPYGDTPLYNSIKMDPARKAELLRPTNVEAQQQISRSLSQGSLLLNNVCSSIKIKTKPLAHLGTRRSQLFDTTVDEEEQINQIDMKEVFKPRTNWKKLDIKLINNAAAIDKNNSFNDGVRNESGSFETSITDLNPNNRKWPEKENTPGSSNIIKKGATLTDSNYYTIPDIRELSNELESTGTCVVNDFQIGRHDFGNILFFGATDITNIDLQSTVIISEKSVEVYPIKEEKPDVGQGLNKPAQITLDRIYFNDKSTGQPIRNYERLEQIGYIQRLKKIAQNQNAEFIDYRPETGSWVFKVEHFTKYGLFGSFNLDEMQDEAIDINSLKRYNAMIKDETNTAAFDNSKSGKTLGKIDAADWFAMADDGMNSVYWQEEKNLDQFSENKVEKDFLIGMDEDMKTYDENKDLKKQKKGIFAEDFELEEVNEMPEVKIGNMEISKNFGVSSRSIQIKKATFFGYDDDIFEDVIDNNDFLSHGNDFDVQKFKIQNSHYKAQIDEDINKSLYGQVPNKFENIKLFKDQIPEKSQDKTWQGSSKNVHQIKEQYLRKTKIEGEKIYESEEPWSTNPLVPFGLNQKQSDKKYVFDKKLLTIRISNDQSIMKDYKNILLDEGMRRHFEIPRVTFNHFGGFLICDSTSISKLEYNQLICKDVIIDPKLIKQIFESCLEIELKHGEIIEYHNNEYLGLASPRNNFNLVIRDYLKALSTFNSDSTKIDFMTSIWSLVDALFGDLDVPFAPQLEGEEVPHIGAYPEEKLRKIRLGRWISCVTKNIVNDEILLVQKMGYQNDCAIPYLLMTAGDIEGAANAAIDIGDFRCALLLSNIASDDDIKITAETQLQYYHDKQMDEFISNYRLKIFCILAGQPIYKTSGGRIIDCYEGLDWIRKFALHLWYFTSENGSIANTVESFEESFWLDIFSNQPFPSHLQNSSDHRIYDVRYELIKLYVDRKYDLNRLFNPASITSDPLDYSVSWHLMMMLESIGFLNSSDEDHAIICVYYANELEQLGLCHWATFVLMHLRMYRSRHNAVKQILDRNIRINTNNDINLSNIINELEILNFSILKLTQQSLDLKKIGEEKFCLDDFNKFLHSKLKIPIEWIASSLEIKYGYYGDYERQAFVSLFCDKQSKCKHLFLNYLATNAVLNGNINLLKFYITALSGVSGFEEIEIYKDFLKLQEIGDISEMNEMELIELKQFLVEMTYGIQHLQKITLLDKLAVEKITTIVLRMITDIDRRLPFPIYLQEHANSLSNLSMISGGLIQNQLHHCAHELKKIAL